MKGWARLVILIIIAALTASLTGCASLFDKSYFSSKLYEGTEPSANTTGDIAVSSYFGLKLAVTQLIAQHRDEARLDLSGYVGDITQDIASACKEASTESAMGAYSVDYITYDLDRIIAFYEAVVYINYRHTAEEVAQVLNVDGEQGLYESLVSALKEGESYLAVSVAATGFGENDAMEYAMRAYRNEPLCSAVVPAFDVTVYTGRGLQKIFEYRIAYGQPAELNMKNTQLQEAVEELGGGITSEGDAYRALQAANILIERCAYDASAGSTAWDALIVGKANGEGMAMAFQALCNFAGVPSQVVSGRLDKVTHYWNMIDVGDEHYHVDVSQAHTAGLGQCFLCTDTDMWGRYWWDTEDYYICEGALDYASLINEQPGQGESEPKPEQGEGEIVEQNT